MLSADALEANETFDVIDFPADTMVEVRLCHALLCLFPFVLHYAVSLCVLSVQSYIWLATVTVLRAPSKLLYQWQMAVPMDT